MKTEPEQHVPIHVLSLGAGVQSSTVAFMAAHRLIEPMPEAGVFADTGAEPRSVYDWLSYLCGVSVTSFKCEHTGLIRPRIEVGIYQSGALPFPVHIVSHGDLIADTLQVHDRADGKGKWTYAGIPSFTLKGSGQRGIAPRQCTWTYKVEELDKRQRHLIGREVMRAWKRKHRPALVELAHWRKMRNHLRHENTVGAEKDPQFVKKSLPVIPLGPWQECQADPLVVCWMGISLDEVERMKTPRHPWQNFRYPLVDMRIKRSDCVAWMAKNVEKIPPRSACDMCPYHTDNEWRRLRDKEPQSFKIAAVFEEEYQKCKAQTLGWDSVPYLHASRVPLTQVDFRTDEDHGQMTFGSNFGSECEGMCGV